MEGEGEETTDPLQNLSHQRFSGSWIERASKESNSHHDLLVSRKGVLERMISFGLPRQSSDGFAVVRGIVELDEG